MPLETRAQQYRALFERTEKKNVDGSSRVVLFSTEDPENSELADLADDGKTGYIRVTEADTGKKIHGIQTSALTARDIMRACKRGTYNPFPKIKNKRSEVKGD